MGCIIDAPKVPKSHFILFPKKKKKQLSLQLRI